MACGEGYGSDVLAAAGAARWSASTPTPRPTSTPACATCGRTCASPATSSRRSRSSATRSCSCRRSSTSATPTRCSSTSRRSSGRAGVVFVTTPNVLTLAPEGAEKSGNPWHVKEYRPEEFRALCEAHFSSVELHGLFHAGKLRLHQLAIEHAGWDAVHARLRITKPFYDRFTPAISARDFALREEGERDLDGRARLPGRLPAVSAGAAGPGELAIVLHTHMPYVEGFGTWPFGEEWLWEAMATSYLPLLDVLDAAPGAARDALDHAGPRPTSSRRRASPSGSTRSRGSCGAGRTSSTPRPRRRRATRWPRTSCGGRSARTSGAADRFAARGGDLVSAFAPHVSLDVGGDPPRAAPPRHRCRRAAAARDGHRRPPRALRRLGRRAVAAGVRTRAVAGPAARAGRGACRLRRAHRRAGRGRAAAAAAHRRRPAARPDRPGGRSTSSGARTGIRPRPPTATATA